MNDLAATATASAPVAVGDPGEVAHALAGGGEVLDVHHLLAHRMAATMEGMAIERAGRTCGTCVHQVRRWKADMCSHPMIVRRTFDGSTGRWSTRLQSCHGERLVRDPCLRSSVGTGVCGTPGRLHEPDGLTRPGHAIAARIRGLRVEGAKW